MDFSPIKEAVALIESGSLREAEAALADILATEPEHFDALRLLGVVRFRLGKREDGIALIRRSASLDGAKPIAHLNLGQLLTGMKRWPEAVVSFEKFIELNPRGWVAYLLLGKAYVALKLPKRAEATLKRCVERNPRFADAHLDLGGLYVREGRPIFALKAFENYTRLRPADPRGWTELVSVLRGLRRFGEVERILKEKLPQFPRHFGLNNALGHLYKETNRFEASLEAYLEVEKLAPDSGAVHSNIGTVLDKMGRLDEAEEKHLRALELSPNSPGIVINWANHLRNVHRLEESAAVLRELLAEHPHNSEAHYTLSFALLSMGDYGNGWKEYVWRWRRPGPQQRLRYSGLGDRPFWNGAEPDGKTILVWQDARLGDFMQFARYIPMLAQRGAKVLVAVDDALKPLLRGRPDVSEVLDPTREAIEAAEFDCHSPLMMLPARFDTDLDSVPEQVPYLHADKGRLEDWRQRLGEYDPPRIGLVWGGGKQTYFDRGRAITLSMLSDATGLEGFSFFSLQVDVNDDERRELNAAGIVDLGPLLTDFGETAAAIGNLDLVVTVDTSVCHLAGALAKEVWMLLSSVRNFMWLREGDTSPWYPTMRIFRQAVGESWEPAIDRLRMELERYKTS